MTAAGMRRLPRKMIAWMICWAAGCAGCPGAVGVVSGSRLLRRSRLGRLELKFLLRSRRRRLRGLSDACWPERARWRAGGFCCRRLLRRLCLAFSGWKMMCPVRRAGSGLRADSGPEAPSQNQCQGRNPSPTRLFLGLLGYAHRWRNFFKKRSSPSHMELRQSDAGNPPEVGRKTQED